MYGQTCVYIMWMWAAMVMPALAAPQLSPEQIVEKLYQPYLSVSDTTPDALAMILPYASSGLRAAIERNQACEKRTQGICAVDFDIIVNAQDWSLSELALRKEGTPPVVSATFLNGGLNDGRHKVSYFFIHEPDGWKIDEIKTVHYTPDGMKDSHFMLRKALDDVE